MEQIPLRAVVGVVLCALSVPLLAQTTEQTLYRQAHEAVRANDMGRFYQIRARLSHYPLLPYLDYYRLAFRPGQADYAEVTRFIRQHADTPQSNRLERSYLQYLAQSQQWSRFLTFYPELPESTGLRCLHYEARYQTGHRDEALKAAESLWMSGESRPDACDGLFALWQGRGLRTQAKVWKRMTLAFEAANPALIRHLSVALGSEQPYGKLMQETLDRPTRVTQGANYPNTAKGREVLLLGLARYANEAPTRALDLLAVYQGRYRFSNGAMQPVEQAAARRLLLDRSTERRSWLDGWMRSSSDEELLELRARLAVWEQDWQRLAGWIKGMPPALQQSERWRYWLARSLEKRGEAGQARTLYREVAAMRGYYGFLAAQRAGAPYRLKNEYPAKVPTWSQAVRHWPFLARVRELKAMNELTAARSEWVHNVDRSEREQKLVLSALAEGQGWHDLAILGTIRAEAWDALDLRFPMPLRQTYDRVAREHGMPSSLLYAISRQESAMYPLAQSPVGARGLMQLMPATARHTAGKIGFPYRSEQQLFNPDVNVRLGSAYLKGLLDNYDGNRIFAAAAYNAGPGRVARWRAQSDGKPVDVWVEGIPFKETRNYVQNILSFNLIYEHKRRQPLKLLSDAELHGRY